MKRSTATFLFSIFSLSLYAQADTTTLNEVTVSSFHDAGHKATSLNLHGYSLKELESSSPYNLSDALAKLPGISQMTTSNAISKPVIRGLYGNRVLVLLSGLRFDNQQFQDEHGLGLSQIGIDRVEVIKGPASLLYGTDAIGGIINIIEETPRTPGTVLDVNTRLYSNTRGTLTDIGYSKYSKKNNWLRIRTGIENHADYVDGNGIRVLDSRNKGYYMKAGYGFNRKRWMMNNAYNFSYNQYGFILNDLPLFFSADGRNSRAMEGPHHNVMLNVFSSQNTFDLGGSLLKVNAGVQSNKRAEDEGGGEISLDMHLLSILENARWEKYLSEKMLIVANQQFTYENNTNLGKRILIPDADMMESNTSAFLRLMLDKINIEGGAGYNYKKITTHKTGIINSGNAGTPEPGMPFFSKARSTANAMLGISYNPKPWLNIKANSSTGNRSANLAELSSNGLHEGVYRCEIGDPNLQTEQNINTDLSIEIDRPHWFVSASGYYNKFHNYIYLSPTTDTWVGFPVYRFRQDDALLYGGEFSGIVRPVSGIQIKDVFSATRGVLTNLPLTDTVRNLPFIPAWKNIFSVKYQHSFSAKLHSFYAEPEIEYSFTQDHPAMFETLTAAYTLLHLHTGITTRLNKTDLKWGFSIRNLLNKAYTDHLSRLKYYGLNNQGVNFVLSLNVRMANPGRF